MKQTTKYLPGFDAVHIENYFLNDQKVIEEIFLISNNTIREDVGDIQNAYKAGNLYLVQEAIHKIKPVFNIIGLLSLEQEVGRFYKLCLKATSLEELKYEYAGLLPKLINARFLIEEQAKLLHCGEEKVN